MTNGETTASFVYNENGLRVQKTVNGVVTDYTLHGKNVVHMKNGNDELHFFYDAQNKPAVVVYNGTPYSYVKNLQGDIVAILDNNGTVVVSYVYDAWGRPISKTGSMASTLGTIQPFRYRSYIFDEETELFYLRSRYHRLSWSRFVNADTKIFGNIMGVNGYCYCLNAPILYNDCDGFTPSASKEIYPVCIDPKDAPAPRTINPWRDWGCGEDITMTCIDARIYSTTIDITTAGNLTDAIDNNADWASAAVGFTIALITHGMTGILVGCHGIVFAASNATIANDAITGIASTVFNQSISPSSFVAPQLYMTTIAIYDASAISDGLVFVMVKNVGEYRSALNTEWNLYDSMNIAAVDYEKICEDVLCLDMIK